MNRQEQIAAAARAATSPGLAGDPSVTIRGYGRTFDADHGTHLSVALVYCDQPDDEPVRLRVSREEWLAALSAAAE